MPFEKGKSGNPDTQFRPGQSGNPSGKPPGTVSRATQLRKWVDLVVSDVKAPDGSVVEGTVEDQLDVAQIAMALTGNTMAYNAIKEELYGKRMQQMIHTGEDGGPIQHMALTPEDVAAFNEKFNKKY